MTTYTTNWNLPKPEASEAPNGPSQIGALADELDDILTDLSGYCSVVLSNDVTADEVTWTPIDTWTTLVQSGEYTVTGEGITVPATGVYRVDLDVLITTTVKDNKQWAMVNLGKNSDGSGVDTSLRIARTGPWTPWTDLGAQGASVHLTWLGQLTAGDEVAVEFYCDRETTGTNTWVVPHPSSTVLGGQHVGMSVERKS